MTSVEANAPPKLQRDSKGWGGRMQPAAKDLFSFGRKQVESSAARQSDLRLADGLDQSMPAL